MEAMSHRAIALALSHQSSNCFLSANPNPSSRPQIRLSLRRSSRSLSFRRCASSLRESASSLDLPLLPFHSDESLRTKPKTFVHFVMEPVRTRESSSRVTFAAIYGCLVLIEKIKRLEVGALVSIRGVGRVNIVDVIQMEPYLRGVVIPMRDQIPDNESEIQATLKELKESLYDLQSLQIKLKASKDELLQTQIKNSLSWAEKKAHKDCYPSFVPNLSERVSFAALQPVSGFLESEVISLQREKLRAMDMRDTLERLKMGISFVKQNIAVVAAKLAIQSLEM